MSTSITVAFNYAPFNIERGFPIDIAKAIYSSHSQPLFSARLFVHVAIDNKLNLFSTFTLGRSLLLLFGGGKIGRKFEIL